MPTHNDETLLERYQREHWDFERIAMSEHTPGKLAVSASLFDNEGCPETVIVGVDKNAFVAVAIDFGENNPNMRDANARRLVAAWNACTGMSTEDLEAMRLCSGYAKKIESLIEERDRLSAINAELLEALKPLAAYPLEEFAMQGKDASRPLFGANEWQLLVGHVKAARAAIAKAQGEQP